MTTTDAIAQRTAVLAADRTEPPTSTPPGRRRRRAPSDVDSPVGASARTRTLVVVGLVLFLVYSVGPVWWLIVNATKNQRDLINTNGLWFAEFNLFDNVRQIFTYQDGIFLRWTGNSLLYAGVGAAVGTLISLACGYGLARFEFAGKKVLMGAVVGAFLIPYAMLTLPLYLLFSQVGIIDTIWAVLIPTVISPFSVYLSKVYVEGAIPAELLEAARLDGAGELRIFFSIVLRMLGTGAATVFLLAFIASWNGFFLPITMLQGAEKWTMTLGLFNWLTQSQTNSGSTFDFTSLVITGALLSVIPLAAVMLAMQRFWKSGVSLGALK